jgi:hypothetical protein
MGISPQSLVIWTQSNGRLPLLAHNSLVNCPFPMNEERQGLRTRVTFCSLLRYQSIALGIHQPATWLSLHCLTFQLNLWPSLWFLHHHHNQICSSQSKDKNSEIASRWTSYQLKRPPIPALALQPLRHIHLNLHRCTWNPTGWLASAASQISMPGKQVCKTQCTYPKECAHSHANNHMAVRAYGDQRCTGGDIHCHITPTSDLSACTTHWATVGRPN